MKRCGGILAHPTSFPSLYGIGDLGEGARGFINFAKKAGIKLWQVLPLGPTSFRDSPYQSFSTFAGNHYLISPDILLSEGYLEESDLSVGPWFNAQRVDYGLVIEYKMNIFRKAFETFKKIGADCSCDKDSARDLHKEQPPQSDRLSESEQCPRTNRHTDFNTFCSQNADWLPDYCLFMAAKNHFIAERKYQNDDAPDFVAYKAANDKYLSKSQLKDYYYGAVWNSWPTDLARRDHFAVVEWSAKLKDEIEFFAFLQYEFFRQWALIKDYANTSGLEIIGDIPIFVAMDSSDVWANKELFQLNLDGNPYAVAGVPPDYFSETGQLWGNPLYFWAAHKKQGYEWWANRIKSALKLVDILRVDHFRGFESYWSVPYGEKTAINGEWLKGPGLDIFESLGKLPIIAEDLGVITDEVNALREESGFPGMAVLQFAFGSDATNGYLPHNFKTTNLICYTGTHDNDTGLGWYNGSATDKERDFIRRYLNVNGDDVAWDLIRLAWSSISAYAITPIQDILNLDGANRMNMPGNPVGNWQFRYDESALTDDIAARLKYLCEIYNR
ncbi:MAG: 4-alpha-glucanotransferase [Clostridiales bacterium]|nr:4-alpha-glucanotransferase [Clostridiales bacterium]